MRDRNVWCILCQALRRTLTYTTTLQQVMETVSYLDETAVSSVRQKFCLFREQRKLNDLRITVSKHFDVLLERICQGGVSAVTKLQALSKWLYGERKGRDVAERAEAFTKMLSSHPPRCKEVLIITGMEITAGAWILKSAPQLQPDESFSAEVPGHNVSTVLSSKYYALDNWNEESLFGQWITEIAALPNSPSKGSNAVGILLLREMNQSSFLAASQMVNVFLLAKNWTPPPANMPSARQCTSALNIPHIGIVVVGGWNGAEMLVEDPSGEGGWRWIELNPMLEALSRPGIAYFNGCVVVDGGQLEQQQITVECLPLTSVEQPTAPQWTRLHGVDKRCLDYTSLVTFSNRLIMLTDAQARLLIAFRMWDVGKYPLLSSTSLHACCRRLPTDRPICPFINPLAIYSLPPLVSLFFCASTSIHPSIHPSTHPSAHSSNHPSIHASIHPSVVKLFAAQRSALLTEQPTGGQRGHLIGPLTSADESHQQGARTLAR
ncbi:hypothetical protein EGR_10825 [Echinococcus granulosus]|uniref:BACK domain-containing protein n=1 Tax=Echinococcus granulosus TaxID=6210 RepID=W6ULB7_ECHGR|nr:hypothetical protein EGR_10825 [Echinococcus granulosus]EUB54314.1 hypothetical protein EGR_10825 [Echinococcus granulosus]